MVRAEKAGPGIDLLEDDAVWGREVFRRPVRMRLFHELEPDRERRARSCFLRPDALLVVTTDPDARDESRRIADEPCVAKVVWRPGLSCRGTTEFSRLPSRAVLDHACEEVGG